MTTLEDGVNYLLHNHDLDEILEALGMEKKTNGSRFTFWVKRFVPCYRECKAERCNKKFLANREDNVYCSNACNQWQHRRTGAARKTNAAD